jgi:hypothetical protein
MLNRVSASIPTQHVAGDTLSATLSGSVYPPAAGWSAQLVFIGPARYTVNATSGASDYTVSTVSVIVAGAYAMRALYTNGAERHTVDLGQLTVTPDPAQAGTTGQALKGAAQLRLDALQAAYDAHIASGKTLVGEYQVAGRTMRFNTLADLLAAINAAKRDVEAERGAARIAAGLGGRTRFMVRM